MPSEPKRQPPTRGPSPEDSFCRAHPRIDSSRPRRLGSALSSTLRAWSVSKKLTADAMRDMTPNDASDGFVSRGDREHSA